MSAQKPKTLDLDKFLPYRLSIVSNKVSRHLANLYSERFNLSIAEWRVLAVLGQIRDLSADEVCIKTAMDKVTVSRAVAKLLAKKYIERTFSDLDRRRSILRLSSRGDAVYTRIVPLARRYEQQLLSGFSKQGQYQLEALLDKLNQQAMDISAAGQP